MMKVWFVISILAVCAIENMVIARTLIVAADSSGEFVHIGEAADSAQFGDTVLVRDGLYEGVDPSGGEEIIVPSGVVVMAEHPGYVAVTVAPFGIVLQGSAKLMGFNMATNPISHVVYLVWIDGGPATLYNCLFHCGPPNSIGAQVRIASNGQAPFIQACGFQFQSPIAYIFNSDSTNVWMSGNYFGTTDTTFIHLNIHDGIGIPGHGYVYISPVSDSFSWLGVDDRSPAAVENISLSVYPNPFNSITTFSLTLPRTSLVSLRIFNVLGQVIYEQDLGRLEAGEHRQVFDAGQLPSGVYLARVEMGGVSQMRKMVVLK